MSEGNLPPPTPEPIALTGALTAPTVAAVRADLLAKLGPSGDVVLDLAGVTDLDASGVQLLASTRKWAQARDRGFAVTSLPTSAASLCEALGLPFSDASTATGTVPE